MASPIEIEVSSIIECPVAEAFEACDSAKLQIAWIASLVAVEIEPGTNWTPGASFRQIHMDSGKRQEFDGLLLDHQPNERIEFQLTHADFSVHTLLSFEDLGVRSKVTQHSSFVLHSFALKMAKGMVRDVVKQRFQEDHGRLKAMLERRT